MFPGGNPLLATPQKVDALLQKLRAYIVWLCGRYNVEFMTLGEFDNCTRHALPVLRCPSGSDWSVCR